jgi:lethal(2) giant larvae protein
LIDRYLSLHIFLFCSKNSEEELVAVDLKAEGWPLYEVPYLHSIHASAITCLAQVTAVAGPVLAALERHHRSGAHQPAVSPNPWPVSGGVVTTPVKPDNTSQGLLLTGHEDGSVRFWGLAGNVLTPLTVFKTAKLFKAGLAIKNPPKKTQKTT